MNISRYCESCYLGLSDLLPLLTPCKCKLVHPFLLDTASFNYIQWVIHSLDNGYSTTASKCMCIADRDRPMIRSQLLSIASLKLMGTVGDLVSTVSHLHSCIYICIKNISDDSIVNCMLFFSCFAVSTVKINVVPLSTFTFIRILSELRRNLSGKRFRNVQDIMVAKPQHVTISFTPPPAQFLIMSIFVQILCLEFVSWMKYCNNQSTDSRPFKEQIEHFYRIHYLSKL